MFRLSDYSVIMKGFTMIKNDRKIATIYSCFKNGDIELWYCCDMVDLMRRGLWDG